MSNNKAQLGDTLTWLVATIIIFVLLFFFIFGASVLGKTKSITEFKPSLFSKSEFKEKDIYLAKSIFTYLSFLDSKKSNDIHKKLLGLEEKGTFQEPYEDKLNDIKSNAVL